MARTVLVVDDSASIRSLICKTLEAAGFSTVQGVHAYDALNQLRTMAAPPALIITDLNMPMMHGIVFVQQLRKLPKLRNTPVLMLTTESRAEEKEKARAAGCSGWVTKPFAPEQLVAVVQQVLG
jgi:two-component system chemotaxis response regulator CheY